MQASRIAAALIALLLTSTATAQLYRWTDPSGRVHFTDTPPPANAKNVQKKRMAAPPSEAGKAAEPFAVQQARKTSPVTLYTAPGCEPCGDARQLLNARGVPFKEVSVADEASAAQLKKAVGGATVPAIVVGESSQMGFEQGIYNALLDKAGYPKAGVLPAKKPAPVAAIPPSPPPAPPAR